MGIFAGHFKASAYSQSSACSYHPTAEWQKCMPVKTPKHPPQPQCSHVCWAFRSANSRPMAPRLRLALPPTAPQQPWQKELAWENGGIFKSAQQPSAHVDQHTFIIAFRGQGQLEDYKLSRGAGKGHILDFPARFSRRPVTVFLGISSGP